MAIRARMGLAAVTLALAFSTAKADQVKYLALPNQSLAAFASAIDGAQHSIDLATFIFEPCHPSTRVLMEKLVHRTRAGVRVRVLLDAFQQSEEQKQNIADGFQKLGISVRFFSNSLEDIDLRMHSKFTVIDGRRLIAGGRNFDDPYFGLSTSLNYVDRDVLVGGVAARQAQAAFEELWNSDMVSAIDSDPADFTPWDQFCAASTGDVSARVREIKSYLAHHGGAALASAPTRVCANVSFHNDNPDYAKESYGAGWQNGRGAKAFLTRDRLSAKRASAEVLKFLSGARSSVVIENWVYMPIQALEDVFAKLRARAVPVDVSTNLDMEDEGPAFFREAEEYAVHTISTRDTDGSEFVRQLSSQGSLASRYELTPAGALTYMHGKVAVRDARDVLVGSFNMDSRSLHINVESVVTVLDCPDLAADVNKHAVEVRAAFEADQAAGTIPPKPEPSEFAKIFAELGLYEF